MSRYTTSVPERSKTDDISVVPKPPTHCDIIGCEAKTDVLTVIVIDNGRERAGPFSEFGFEKHAEKGSELRLRAQYTFVGWVARCSHHHLRDLYRAGKGSRSDLAQTDRLSVEHVRQYTPNPAWERIGSAPERSASLSPQHVSAAVPQEGTP